jgi:hypothetical protein
MGKGGIGDVIGDVVGGGLGFLGGSLIGMPELGLVTGGALGGFGASAAQGGSLTSDLLAGASGAALGYGAGETLGVGAAGSALGGTASDAVGGAAGFTGDATGATVALDAASQVAPDAVTGAAGVTGDATSAASGLGLGSTAAPAGASAGSVAGPGLGTELSAGDQSLLSGQGALASGGTNNVGLATGAVNSVPGPIAAGTDAGSSDAAPAAQALGATPTADASGGLGSVIGGPQATSALATAGGTNVGQGASLLDQAGSWLSSPTGKLAGVGVAGLGLAKNLLSSNTIPGESNIQSLASSSQTQGALLQQYLQNGTLPPAVQTSVNAATQDGITAIKAKYAQMGVAPNSQAEVQDIARLQQNAVIQGATLADQLLQQGISESQLSGQLYNDLVTTNTAQNNQTNSAIGNLASALAGGGTKIQIGGTTTT